MKKLEYELWLEWREHPVTKATLTAIEERVQSIVEEILATRDSPTYDIFLKGMIHAYREFLDVKPALLDDVFQEESTDEVSAGDTGTSRSS